MRSQAYVKLFLFLIWFQLFAIGCQLTMIREAVMR